LCLWEDPFCGAELLPFSWYQDEGIYDGYLLFYQGQSRVWLEFGLDSWVSEKLS